MKKIILPILATALLFSISAACGKAETKGRKGVFKEETGKVLATVNGVAIKESDVRLNLQKRRYRGKISPELKKETLETIIQEELKYQKAVELGLDKDENYQRRLARLEASIIVFKRNAMGRLFHKKQIAEKASITDEEAKKYFDENKEKIQSEMHVWQILYKDNEKGIKEALEKIKSGVSFDEVAREPFPKLPENSTPWDMGYMPLSKIPIAWREVVAKMEIGELSGIIKGSRNRMWILKLIDRRVNPDIGFERQKINIKNVLISKKISALNEKALKELREKAKIVYKN